MVETKKSYNGTVFTTKKGTIQVKTQIKQGNQ